MGHSGGAMLPAQRWLGGVCLQGCCLQEKVGFSGANEAAFWEKSSRRCCPVPRGGQWLQPPSAVWICSPFRRWDDGPEVTGATASTLPAWVPGASTQEHNPPGVLRFPFWFPVSFLPAGGLCSAKTDLQTPFLKAEGSVGIKREGSEQGWSSSAINTTLLLSFLLSQGTEIQNRFNLSLWKKKKQAEVI